MKRLAIMAIVVMLVVGFSMLALAETGTDRLADTLTGKNDSCPLLAGEYVAYTFKNLKVLDVEIPLRVKAEYEHSARSFVKDNSAKVSVGFEF